ncbi:MAG: hypothetical protein ACREO9_07300 [Lysobacterales bacterium]
MSHSYNTQRHYSGRKHVRLAATLLTGVLLFCAQLYAAETGSETETLKPDPWKVKTWRFQTSLWTHHWSYNPEHNDDQNLIDVEALFENNWLAGGAIFDNSFGQNSWFLYMGYEWPLFHSKYAYFKLVGGILYGYKDEYKDKIPLNGNEIAPAILPVLGLRYKWLFTELDIAGTAAITWTAGIQF